MLKQTAKKILNGLLSISGLVAFIFLSRFVYRLDIALNVCLGKWYLLYCVLLLGIIALIIYLALKDRAKLQSVFCIPFIVLGVGLGIALFIRIYLALGGTPSGGGAPFFDPTDPDKIDFWYYIWTGNLK